MNLFHRIKALCDEKDVSMSRLEQDTSLANGSIRKWEKAIPSADRLQKVAEYFNVSMDYLLGKTAFKKPTELFEHWSGHNNPYFESLFDFGGLLKEVREAQGISQKEVSEALNITESDVDDIEEGILPLNYEWAEKYANFLGTSVMQVFIDNGMCDSLDDIPLELLHHYQEQGMSETEMAIAYTKIKRAVEEDAVKEGTPELKPNADNKKPLKEFKFETYPVSKRVKVPIIGTVTAGPNGIAYEDYQGEEWVDTSLINSADLFYLRIKGDSMTGDGILPGDLALVQETPEVRYGALGVAIINGEEGTLKRVYQNDDSIILQSSNPKYPPRVFKKEEMGEVRIIGAVRMIVRNCY
ncbi:MAG: S24 family peptidase [Eubacteriales bacterium]|jgi:SOS-response transcriptional repressor LexA